MIPIEIRERLAADSFMYQCCVADDDCGGKIEWNHALIYAGKKVEVWWAILPMCLYHHANTDRKDIRKKLVRIMRKRSGGELKEFEKVKRYV